MPPATQTQNQTNGAVLRALREGVGLSLDEMAAKSGVSKTSLHAYETGRRAIGNGALYAVLSVVASALYEQAVA